MTEATVQVTIPAPTAEASKSWRKTLTGIDHTQDKGRAIQGDWLDANATYKLPVGGLILAYDRTGDHHIRILKVTNDATLAEVKTLTRKGVTWAGPATLKAIAKLIVANPWPGPRPVKLGHTPNRDTSPCYTCHHNVPAGEGVEERNDKGYRFTRHHAGKCPPKRNSYADNCRRCGGWMDPEEGILVDPTPTINTIIRSPLVPVHEGQCPPPEQRKVRPPTINERDETCATCGQNVPAGDGLYHYDTRTVTHNDICPTPTAPTAPAAPTWIVTRTLTAPRRINPGRGFSPAETLRATIHGDIPTDAPGYQPRNHGASVIVTVVREDKPWYSYDEDGNSPGGLIGRDGWVYAAHVRIATADEASAVLASEAHTRRRIDLTSRVGTLLEHARDGEIPATVDPDEVRDLPVVPLSDRNRKHHEDIVLIDHKRQVLWLLRYNGADGDNWGASNYGNTVARRLPITAERAQLLRDLYAEYDADTAWIVDGYAVEAISMLKTAGYTLQHLRHNVKGLTAHGVADAQAFLARTPRQWRDAGWDINDIGAAVPAADAARLADAGITRHKARLLDNVGALTVDAKLSATPPALPTTPGRYRLPIGHRDDIYTDNHDQAQRALVGQPQAWRTWTHTPDITCLHTGPGWQLWSDWKLTAGTWRGDPVDELSDSAVDMLAVVARCGNRDKLTPEAVQALSRAVAHVGNLIDQAEQGNTHKGGCTLQLHHYSVTWGSGSVLWMWTITEVTGGPTGGGDYDATEEVEVYVGEQTMRKAWTAALRRTGMLDGRR